MGIFTEEIAIDLGTANTLIIHNDKVVINSPSIVAIDRVTNKIIAIGDEANIMQGKTHENIKTVRPLKDGVIADFEASEQMISTLIKSIPTLKRRWFSPSLTFLGLSWFFKIDLITVLISSPRTDISGVTIPPFSKNISFHLDSSFSFFANNTMLS